MIITGALSLIVTLIISVLPEVALALPDEAMAAVVTAMDYLTDGVNFLVYILGPTTTSAMAAMLSLVIDIEIFLRAWDLGWWVIKKIPFFNIRE